VSIDSGFFGPSSVTWHLHADPAMWIGGISALHLQALHPVTALGIARNSSYEQDPGRRLRETGKFIVTTTWGTTAQAEQAGARIRAMHARMRIREPHGVERRLDDHDLLLRSTAPMKSVPTDAPSAIGATATARTDGVAVAEPCDQPRFAAVLVGPGRRWPPPGSGSSLRSQGPARGPRSPNCRAARPPRQDSHETPRTLRQRSTARATLPLSGAAIRVPQICAIEGECPGVPKPVVIERESDALLRNIAEGALAALAAITAMVVLCVAALSLLHAGSIGSVGSLTAAVMAMAVGSPVAVGSGSSGSGFIQISLGGSIDALPLGVTLVGTAVLGFGFFRPLRRHAQVSGGGLLVRAQSAVTVIAVAFVPLGRMARGSLTVPQSAVSHLGGCSSGSGGLSGLLGGSGGSGGGLSSLLGGSGGTGGGLSSMLGGVLSSLTFSTGIASAVFGSVLWASLVLAVGCLVARRTSLPPSIARNPVVCSWRPSVSAVTAVLVTIMGVLVVGTCAAVVAGGAGARVVGEVLLAVPNLVLVALGLGAGAPWSASFGRAQGQSQGGLLSSLMGSIQGSCGSSGRVENLRTMFVAGFPLWALCLLLLMVVLLACGYIAAARTPNRTGGPGRAWYSRHLAAALRLGVVTALVLWVGTLLVDASGQVSFGAFSMQMGGMQANLGSNALLALILGLLTGGAAGFAGSLLRGAVGPADRGPQDDIPAARDRSGTVRSARNPVSSSAPRR